MVELPPPQAFSQAAPSTGRAISIALLVVSITFSTIGQLTLKAAMNRVGRIGSAEVSAVGDTISKAAKEPLLWLGLFLFALSALFWLVVLSRVPLSLAYPMVGVSYIFVVLLGRVVLNEHIPVLRWVGAFVIAAGIALIGISFGRVSGN
jgi:drug/metabolite transporter (DMT)-like permease